MNEARMIMTERYDASEYGKINENVCEKEKIYYTSIGTKYLYEAMNNLTHSELLLWLAYMSNEDGYIWKSYYKQIEIRTGMSLISFHRAFKGLESKQYITKLKNNVYICHLSPTERKNRVEEISA